MSAVKRQRTCAACGAPLLPEQLTDLEPLLDGTVRYVAVHAGHSTHPRLRAPEVAR
jgi:hypothetical protein